MPGFDDDDLDRDPVAAGRALGHHGSEQLRRAREELARFLNGIRRRVERGRVMEASLGYFITPFVNVALGMLFLRERLRRPTRENRP